MYVLTKADLCEMGTAFPMMFRYGETVLGLKDWKVQSFNMDTNEIDTISNVNVYEVARQVHLTTINGKHFAGFATLKLNDASGVSIGNVIRVGNLVFNILDIDIANNTVMLDRTTKEDINDGVTVSLVETPEFLGVYKAEVPMDRLGKFMITMTDTGGKVNPISNLVEVVVSLDSSVSSNGRVDPIGGNTMS